MIAYSYYIGGIYIIECTGWYVDNEGIAEFKIANDPNPFTKLYADRLDISKEDETTAFDPIRGSVKEQLYNTMYEHSEQEKIKPCKEV